MGTQVPQSGTQNGLPYDSLPCLLEQTNPSHTSVHFYRKNNINTHPCLECSVLTIGWLMNILCVRRISGCVSLHVCVSAYACGRVCVCIGGVSLFMYMSVCVYVSVFLSVFVCVFVSVSECVWECQCISVSPCVCVCFWGNMSCQFISLLSRPVVAWDKCQ